MPREKIYVEGRKIETLAELLRPGLRFIVVGLNPSPVSVQAGHYYQGQLGRRIVFGRLQNSKIVGPLPKGREDEVAFKKYGVGFADLVRRPSNRADSLTRAEKAQAVPGLLRRLGRTGDKPPLLFVFKDAFDAAAAALSEAGYTLHRMPPPYDPTKDVELAMARLRKKLGGQR